MGWRVSVALKNLPDADSRQWVTEEGPALGSGIKGAVVASYHTYVDGITTHVSG